MTQYKNPKQSALIQGLLLFVLPLIELWLIRSAWHEILGKNIFSLGFHQTDVLPGIAVGIAVLFYLYHQQAPFPISFNRRGAALHAGIIVLFSALMRFFDLIAVKAGPRVASAFMLFFFTITIASSLLVLVRTVEWKTRYYGAQRQTLAVALGIFFLTIYPYIIEYYWRYLAQWVGVSVYYTLKTMGMDVSYRMGQTLFLHHRVLTARVMKPCSGLEGIFLFLFTFTLVWGFDKGRLSFNRRIAAYVGGVLLMFSLNIARIVAFFGFSVGLARTALGREPGQVLQALFHSGVGLVFYFVGIAAFLYVVYRPLRKSVGIVVK